MGIPDKHDPRPFTHLAKLDGAGNVVAIVEVADADVVAYVEAANEQHVDITGKTEDEIPSVVEEFIAAAPVKKKARRRGRF